MEGQKASANKSKATSAIILVVELDIKPLLVSYPEQIFLSKINKNDDLQLDIEYDGDPDQYSLFLSLFYKLEVVATKKQNFTSFAFQIWDLFSAFQDDSSEILVRVSLYDPEFFMPSVSTVRIDVNFEPLGGGLVVSPLFGSSLETDFTLTASNFLDGDSPLSYRFYYYLNGQQYDLERELGVSPVNSRRDFLADAGFKNELKVKLPMGSAGSGMDVLIMVSVVDSLGAVTNSTREVKVEPRYPGSLPQQMNHYRQYFDQRVEAE